MNGSSCTWEEGAAQAVGGGQGLGVHEIGGLALMWRPAPSWGAHTDSGAAMGEGRAQAMRALTQRDLNETSRNLRNFRWVRPGGSSLCASMMVWPVRMHIHNKTPQNKAKQNLRDMGPQAWISCEHRCRRNGATRRSPLVPQTLECVYECVCVRV